jgi:hypothetical protein
MVTARPTPEQKSTTVPPPAGVLKKQRRESISNLVCILLICPLQFDFRNSEGGKSDIPTLKSLSPKRAALIGPRSRSKNLVLVWARVLETCIFDRDGAWVETVDQ